MTDRPIIFSGPMVRALLEGRKTQTRRLASSPLARCVPGDRLWVRENTRLQAWDDEGAFWVRYMADEKRSGALYPPDDDFFERVCNRLDKAGVPCSDTSYDTSHPAFLGIVTRPSIHMPRWASRLTLIVTDVRRERLHDISEADCRAEGVARNEEPCDHKRASCDEVGCLGRTYKATFCDLWALLNGWESWKANPEVVALTFRVERSNIDKLPQQPGPKV